MKILALATMALVAGQMYAQNGYRKHNITVGGGGAIPSGELRDYFDTAPYFNVAYGYRFYQLFQADIGFETVFGAAGVRDFVQTGFGDLRIKDREYFVPMGGRVVVPLSKERVLLYGGGGGLYMRYGERINQPFSGAYGGYRIDCSVCTVRDGWGYYGLVGADFALDYGRHFRIGATGKVYRGHTNGEPLGLAPPLETRDHWVNVGAHFTFAF